MQNKITKQNLKVHKPDYLFQPQLGHIKVMDFHLAKWMIEEGYKMGKKAVPKIRKMI